MLHTKFQTSEQSGSEEEELEDYSDFVKITMPIYQKKYWWIKPITNKKLVFKYEVFTYLKEMAISVTAYNDLSAISS